MTSLSLGFLICKMGDSPLWGCHVWAHGQPKGLQYAGPCFVQRRQERALGRLQFQGRLTVGGPGAVGLFCESPGHAVFKLLMRNPNRKIQGDKHGLGQKSGPGVPVTCPVDPGAGGCVAKRQTATETRGKRVLTITAALSSGMGCARR